MTENQNQLSASQQELMKGTERPDHFEPNLWDPYPLPYDSEYISPAYAKAALENGTDPSWIRQGIVDPYGFQSVFKQQMHPTDPHTNQHILYDEQSRRYGVNGQVGAGFKEFAQKAYHYAKKGYEIGKKVNNFAKSTKIGSRGLRVAHALTGDEKYKNYADKLEQHGYGNIIAGDQIGYFPKKQIGYLPEQKFQLQPKRRQTGGCATCQSGGCGSCGGQSGGYPISMHNHQAFG
jgi:hypothetical protein